MRNHRRSAPRRFLLLLLACAAAAPGSELAGEMLKANWRSRGQIPGPDTVPMQVVQWRDGLVIRGQINPAAGAGSTWLGDELSYLLRYKGGVWSRLDAQNRVVQSSAMAVYGDDLLLDSAGTGSLEGIQRWNGSSYTRMGTFPSSADHLAASASEAFCASSSKIYRWTGNAWSQIGDSGSTASIKGLAVLGDDRHQHRAPAGQAQRHVLERTRFRC